MHDQHIKMKRIIMDEFFFNHLIERLENNGDYCFRRDRDAEHIKYNSIDVSSYQADIQTGYIQLKYDVNTLHNKINELNKMIASRDEEINKLRNDKTAALKEFVEELRKEPLKVVMIEQEDELDEIN